MGVTWETINLYHKNFLKVRLLIIIFRGCTLGLLMHKHSPCLGLYTIPSPAPKIIIPISPT